MGTCCTTVLTPDCFSRDSLIGYEVELWLLNHTIWTVSQLFPKKPEWLTVEFLKQVIEVINPQPHCSPESAIAELRMYLERLSEAEVDLAYFSARARHDFLYTFSQDVTKPQDPYYQWVDGILKKKGAVALSAISHVGAHISSSHPHLEGDALFYVYRFLVHLGYLFVPLVANSPYKNGKQTGTLSRRILEYPNRMFLFENEKHFWAWMTWQESQGLVYPGKNRAWMLWCPRVSEKGEWRIENRVMDFGRNTPLSLLTYCGNLQEILISIALEWYAHGDVLPSECVWGIEDNYRSTAVRGRDAWVMFYGERMKVGDVASYILEMHSLSVRDEYLQRLSQLNPAEAVIQNGGIPEGCH